MTVDFFLKAYDFNEFKIEKAVLKNGLLKIYVTINAHLDLIANGYRPELDVDYDAIFGFLVDKDNDEIDDVSSFNCLKNGNDYYLYIGKNRYRIVSDNILF